MGPEGRGRGLEAGGGAAGILAAGPRGDLEAQESGVEGGPALRPCPRLQSSRCPGRSRGACETGSRGRRPREERSGSTGAERVRVWEASAGPRPPGGRLKAGRDVGWKQLRAHGGN